MAQPLYTLVGTIMREYSPASSDPATQDPMSKRISL
ncbi:hypothetical protein EYZ11_006231 [Aspergillus tanneri]|uniref:Uncharacterized protein n=1 Tax=Aspergillus tanneri TaxID=1220188 RepID=A0A4S3JGJ8_9EURO|nr:hypothetical protein EYZ11_006231 [Aspergillus tanneri]